MNEIYCGKCKDYLFTMDGWQPSTEEKVYCQECYNEKKEMK